jgi:ABC-type thiamin/hydroxymethylpyrimidine transport system permease subunit
MNKIVVLILTAIFGLFFLAFGVYGTVVEFRTPPLHTVHLAFFLFFILFGAVLMPGVGTIIFAKLKDSAALARDMAPTFGRRASQGEVAIAPPEKPKPDVMPGEGKP